MAVLLAILRGINAAPGGAIFLWSWINYTVLTRGYTQPICVSDSVQVANVNSDIETEPEGIGTFDSAGILMSGLEGESVPESREGDPSDLGDAGGSGIESK